MLLHRSSRPSRSSVGTMSSRSAQLTQACSSGISSCSTVPPASLTVRVRIWDSGSIRCRTATARGRSHARLTMALSMAVGSTPVTTISGVLMPASSLLPPSTNENRYQYAGG
jgi:hypothetical protein